MVKSQERQTETSPPYWRCRFTTTTVLGNGRCLYCSYYFHGTDSARLFLSSAASVACLTLVLYSSHWFPLFLTLSDEAYRALSRMNKSTGRDIWEQINENKESEINTKPVLKKRQWCSGMMKEGESAVWTRSTGDMSHGEQSPRGLVGAVYKWK